MKVLHVDHEMRQVVFFHRFCRNTSHTTHTHRGSAIAYTISGTWRYDGEPFPDGTVAFEPAGSTHTPMTRNGETAEVLVILTADNEEGVLLELNLEDGTKALFTLDVMAKMQRMKSQAEFSRLLPQITRDWIA